MRLPNHSPHSRFLNYPSLKERFESFFLAVPFMVCISLIAVLPWIAS